MNRLLSADLGRLGVILVLVVLMHNHANAEENPDNAVVGIEFGALFVIGTDLQIYYRHKDSPLVLGFRYLETEDDFINEAVVGLPDDSSDREFITRSGPFIRYLLAPDAQGSYYLSAALFRTREEIECGEVSNEDTATSPYFGGGYMGGLDQSVSYNIGFMLAPGENLNVDAGACESDSDGNFDVSLGVSLNF